LLNNDFIPTGLCSEAFSADIKDSTVKSSVRGHLLSAAILLKIDSASLYFLLRISHLGLSGTILQQMD